MRMQLITAALLVVPVAVTTAAAQDTTQSRRDSTSQRNQYGNQYGNQSGNQAQQWNQGPQSDEAVVMRIHKTNLMEIRAAQLAQRNASSSKVKSFAARLIKDHQSADRKLGTVAKKMGVTLSNFDPNDAGSGKGRNGLGADSAQRGDSMSHPTDREGYPRTYGDSTNRQGQGQYGQRGDSTMMQQGDSTQRQGDDRAQMMRLQQLRGAAFDTAFANAMVQGHQKAIAMLEGVQGQTQSTQSQDRSQSQYPSDSASRAQSQQSQDQQYQSGSQMQYQTQSSDLKAFIASVLPTLRQHLQIAQSLTNSATTTSSSQQ